MEGRSSVRSSNDRGLGRGGGGGGGGAQDWQIKTPFVELGIIGIHVLQGAEWCKLQLSM